MVLDDGSYVGVRSDDDNGETMSCGRVKGVCVILRVDEDLRLCGSVCEGCLQYRPGGLSSAGARRRRERKPSVSSRGPRRAGFARALGGEGRIIESRN